MPVILPQLPKSMFTSYDPKYTPGYTSFVPKLRSDIGKVYGNANLRFLDHEPGLRRTQRVSFMEWDNQHGPSRSAHLDRRVFDHHSKMTVQGHEKNWNNQNGYFHQGDTKYPFTQMRHTHDGDPRTSSVIYTVEQIKHDLNKPMEWMPSEPDRYGSLRHEQDSMKYPSSCHERSEQIYPSSNLLPTGNVKMKEINDREPAKNICKTNDYIQKRQGKLIYRTDGGLMPNYSGYTPGQMFAFGKTWGRSSRNAIEKVHGQPFLWTSLL
ncbi:uncharacterized protein LOC128474122 [Spea bombifrons]|uniref:uncharacterized protein LOC128474122 n=1 Tax=Spea bombifrons TaxID=233779 RepID=UPI00234BBCA9|nr:uncharacterized protein LOC128474122 [Spea bombifrons]